MSHTGVSVRCSMAFASGNVKMLPKEDCERFILEKSLGLLAESDSGQTFSAQFIYVLMHEGGGFKLFEIYILLENTDVQRIGRIHLVPEKHVLIFAEHISTYKPKLVL